MTCLWFFWPQLFWIDVFFLLLIGFWFNCFAKSYRYDFFWDSWWLAFLSFSRWFLVLRFYRFFYLIFVSFPVKFRFQKSLHLTGFGAELCVSEYLNFTTAPSWSTRLPALTSTSSAFIYPTLFRLSLGLSLTLIDDHLTERDLNSNLVPQLLSLVSLVLF